MHSTRVCYVSYSKCIFALFCFVRTGFACIHRNILPFFSPPPIQRFTVPVCRCSVVKSRTQLSDKPSGLFSRRAGKYSVSPPRYAADGLGGTIPYFTSRHRATAGLKWFRRLTTIYHTSEITVSSYRDNYIVHRSVFGIDVHALNKHRVAITH